MTWPDIMSSLSSHVQIINYCAVLCFTNGVTVCGCVYDITLESSDFVQGGRSFGFFISISLLIDLQHPRLCQTETHFQFAFLSGNAMTTSVVGACLMGIVIYALPVHNGQPLCRSANRLTDWLVSFVLAVVLEGSRISYESWGFCKAEVSLFDCIQGSELRSV